jgi:hypothetical protein
MMEESIQYAETINADWCTFNAVKPLLGTPVYDEMVAENYIGHDPEYWSQTSYGAREFDTKEISKENLNDLLYDANININFFNNYNLRAGNYLTAISTIEDIVNDYPYHIVGMYVLHLCYKKMGIDMESRKQLDKIKMLVESNPQSSSMFRKYGNKMSDLENLLVDLNSGEENFQNTINFQQSFEQETAAEQTII